MSNSTTLAQLGEALYGQRWKADLAGDLGLSARMLRLYAAGSQAVPNAVVEKARGLARTRADALLALAGDAPPVASAKAEARPVDAPLDGDAYLALARRLGSQRPAGRSAADWAAECSSTRRVRSRDTGVELQLRGVGTLELQLWSDVGRLEVFNLRNESDRLALNDYTLAEPV